ncbi:hypothetical protein BDF20DRAFT_912560 [Mycotypha africana]|uniref:uncharacterized protein n=1 Tax=Mycotypha africana TaxID=64632 RepID=UPI002300070D|nr:uncharacterized protein BDF20DRAFT_912560 [Mycotypha africana]KAI8982392.1 hypothetical protein BDF20DRAFT_912560 [Mycotypha africana]
MNEVAKVLFLENCGIYALENSIATNNSASRVVTIRDLEEHFESSCPTFLALVNATYASLESFLKKDAKQIVRAGLIQNWRDWIFEVMDYERYERDRRQEYGIFSPLNRLCSHDTLLFVLVHRKALGKYTGQRIKDKKAEKKVRLQQERLERHSEQQVADQIATEQEKKELAKLENHRQQQATQKSTVSLNDQIIQLYHTKKMTQQFWANSKSLILRIQKMINNAFRGRNYQVMLFGSTANQLCLKDADLDLCIRIPDDQFEYDQCQNKYKSLYGPRSVYNMNYIATLFRAMGMQDVEAIVNAKVPICKFVDPVTGIRCDINTHNVLGLENTKLIGQYIDMDKRVRPLLMVIKYFVKQKNLNSSVGGTLSSYAYVIMLIHFLIVGLENPVLPCLQDLNSLQCSSSQCKSKRNARSFYGNTIWQDNQLCDLRYHDCVRIQNTPSYDEPNSPIGENRIATLWYGSNRDSIAELLHKFFHYYSDPRNYVVSIIQANGGLVGASEDDRIFRKHHFVIQDPFLRKKNLARTCTEVGSRAILKEFQRAAKLTAPHLPSYNTQLANLCDPSNILARPLDKLCMEYRMKNTKHGSSAEKRGGEFLDIQQTLLTAQQEQLHEEEDSRPQQDQVIGIFEEITQDDFEQQLSGMAHMTPADATPTATPSLDTMADTPDTLPQQPTELTMSPPLTVKMQTEEQTAGKEIKMKEIQDSTAAQSDKRIHEVDPFTSTTVKGTMNDEPIIKLVKYLLHYYTPYEKSVSTEDKQQLQQLFSSRKFVQRMLKRPAVEMDKLICEPSFEDVPPKQISFLIAQLRYYIDSYVTAVVENDDTFRSTGYALVGKQVVKKEYSESRKQHDKNSCEIALFGMKIHDSDIDYVSSDYDSDDGFDDYGPCQEGEEEQIVPKHKIVNASEESQVHKYTREKMKLTAAPNGFKKEYTSSMTKRYTDDSKIDLHFLVSKVPKEDDSYELFQEFSWYGQVYECRLAETLEDNNNDTSYSDHYNTWHVHIKSLFGLYTSGVFFNIKLNKYLEKDHDEYQVSLPSLVPF